MTAHFNKTLCQALIIAGLAVSFSAVATPGFAWNSETKAKCVGDAFRLCSSSIGDDKATEACMNKQSAQLTAACKNAVEKERAAAKPAAAKPAPQAASPAASPAPAPAASPPAAPAAK